jgi:hypothetical protein
MTEFRADLFEKAKRQATQNWKNWKDDFEHTGAFCDLPVLQSAEKFMGFLFEYSLLRNHTAKEARALFKELKMQRCFKDPLELHNALLGASHKKHLHFRRVQGESEERRKLPENMHSMCSKLACLWNPKEFCMWDQFARLGLWIFRGKPRREKHLPLEAYSTKFNASVKDFNNVAGRPKIEGCNCDEVAARRIFDAYLMLLGKEQKKSEDDAKKKRAQKAKGTSRRL